MAADIVTQVLTGLIALMGVIILAGAFIVLWLIMKFKIRVVVKDHTQGGSMIFDRARISKGDDDTERWKLQKLKKTIKVDAKAIGHTTRGKPYAFFHRIDEDTFVPVIDDGAKDMFEGDSASIKFNPLPSKLKGYYVHQIRKNERYKKKNLNDLIASAVPYAAIIIILVMGLIFVPDIISKTKEVTDGLANAAAKQADSDKAVADAMNRLVDYLEDTETISSDENSPTSQSNVEGVPI